MFETLITVTAVIALGGAALWVMVWVPPQFRRHLEYYRSDRESARPVRAARRGQFDIAPGESRMADGRIDVVLEASMQSFPASDPPGSY